MRKALAMLGTLAVLASMAACGSPPSESVPEPIVMQDVTYTRDVDIRRWRAETERTLKTAPSGEFARRIVADDVLTADEMNEFHRRVKQCFAERGYEYTVDAELRGGMVERIDGRSVAVDRVGLEETNAVCDGDSGYSGIWAEYKMAMANPDHVDLGPYVVQCLVDNGLVGPQYTVADYIRDSQNRTGPYKVQDEDPESVQGRQVTQCGRDPLGKLQ